MMYRSQRMWGQLEPIHTGQPLKGHDSLTDGLEESLPSVFLEETHG